jgi:hypothetical protein
MVGNLLQLLRNDLNLVLESGNNITPSPSINITFLEKRHDGQSLQEDFRVGSTRYCSRRGDSGLDLPRVVQYMKVFH